MGQNPPSGAIINYYLKSKSEGDSSASDSLVKIDVSVGPHARTVLVQSSAEDVVVDS